MVDQRVLDLGLVPPAAAGEPPTVVGRSLLAEAAEREATLLQRIEDLEHELVLARARRALPAIS